MPRFRIAIWILPLVAVALALGTLAHGAAAGEVDCRAIEGTNERLACYDAAFSPEVKKPAAVQTDGSRGAYKDPFVAEEARTAAKLKNICRGC